MADDILTFARLRELLAYDPETGVFTWRICAGPRARKGAAAGWSNPKGYTMIRIDGRNYFVHRLAHLAMTGEWPNGVTDHINGIKSDNRWSNLRDVTHITNMQNQRRAASNNRTGLLGVCADGDRFRATITHDGVCRQIGAFATAAEAHAAYVDAKRRLHPGCTL